jgi:hypothetical protein
MEIDQDKYVRTIPPWCSLRTLQEHMEIGLCWSLQFFVESDKPVPLVNCYRCDLRRPETPSPASILSNSHEC